MGKHDSSSVRPKTKGLLGFYGLESWWLSEFSEDERLQIAEKFQPLGDSGDPLSTGDVDYTSQSVVGFLQSLAGWFVKAEDRPIAYKIIHKAEELSKTDASVLDLHFLFGQKLATYYMDRERAGCLERAIEACSQQIGLSEKASKAFQREYRDSPLPSHKGYQQLAIILEKQAKFEEAIELCQSAAKQGWAGDWEKRIERCRKKQKKQME